VRILNLKKLLFLCLTLAAVAAPAAAQEKSAPEALSPPAQVGDFRGEKALGAAFDREPVSADDFLIVSSAQRFYTAPNGEKYNVSFVQTRTAAAAYSLLRYSQERIKLTNPYYRFRTVEGLGVAGVAGSRVKFAKGTTFVHVAGEKGPADAEAAALSFARLLAGALEGEPVETPALVLHLPEWEKRQEDSPPSGIGYAVRPAVLKSLIEPRGQPVLDLIDFDGGAEAATAQYDAGRLVVVEFTTPQHAFDADAAVNQRLNELRAAGQPAPALYRREGNYAVFVFDAPDAAAAEQLAAGVKYEKDVRWLGRNPHADEVAVREYTATMGGTILAVIITTGFAIVGCLAVGAAVGGVIFLRRRARLAEQEVYTDAGGMLRLNLEDLNTPPASRLLGQGKE
jgi:hypothetical protein